MAISNTMQFKIKTLIDITETNARFNKTDPAWQQQQNFLTVLQTIGLRTNPTSVSVTVDKLPVKYLDFGTAYKGYHNVWTMLFSIEAVDSTSVEILENDINNVPVINKLDETIDFLQSVFKTKDQEFKNIIFKYVDNND
jgi:hypothetical protein